MCSLLKQHSGTSPPRGTAPSSLRTPGWPSATSGTPASSQALTLLRAGCGQAAMQIPALLNTQHSPVRPQNLLRPPSRSPWLRDCNFNGVTPEMEETPVTDVTTDNDQAPVELSAGDEQVLRELTERARTGGLRLTGEGGLLGKLTKMGVEGALEAELDDPLGYGRHDPAGPKGHKSRNGHRAKNL